MRSLEPEATDIICPLISGDDLFNPIRVLRNQKKPIEKQFIDLHNFLSVSLSMTLFSMVMMGMTTTRLTLPFYGFIPKLRAPKNLKFLVLVRVVSACDNQATRSNGFGFTAFKNLGKPSKTQRFKFFKQSFLSLTLPFDQAQGCPGNPS